MSLRQGNRVLTLPAGSTNQSELPLRGLKYSRRRGGRRQGHGVRHRRRQQTGCHAAGGATTQVELPFTALKYPHGIAVDGEGAVYVTDYDTNRVVKLAPE